VARKHLGWYWRFHREIGRLPAGVLTTESAMEQLSLVSAFLSGLAGQVACAA
jgi:hypothetical protein